MPLLLISMVLADASSSPFFQVGAGVSVVALASMLLTEYRKSNNGAWKVVKQRNADLHYKDWQIEKRDFRIAQLETDARIRDGLLPAGAVPDVADPGPYKPPTAQELEKL